MQKDNYFDKPNAKQFEFDSSIVPVFDDMLKRSVPMYEENLDLCASFIVSWADSGKTVVDLGSSTGSLLLKIAKKDTKNLKLIGIDNSQAMIDQAILKSKAFGYEIEFLCQNVEDLKYQNLAAVSANYLLQFIRPPKRQALVEKVCSQLEDGGIFIFSEKLVSNQTKLDKIMIDCYLDFKRQNGYSDYEISQKREALENVLIPYSAKENEEMIMRAGFRHFETILKWNNFATFVAIK